MEKDHRTARPASGRADIASDSLHLEHGMEVVARVRESDAESESSRADHTLHTIIRNMQEIVLLLDRNLTLIEASKTAIEVMELPPDPKNIRFTPEVNMGRVTDSEGRAFEFDKSLPVRVLRGERLENEQLVWKFSDGSTGHFLVNGTPIRSITGEIDLVLLVGRDITQLRELQLRTEDAVAAVSGSDDSLRELIDSMAVCVILLDSELRLIGANKAYSREFGGANALRQGVSIEEALPQARECGMVDLLTVALKSGRPVRVKCFRYEGLSRGTTYWNGSAVPVGMQGAGDRPASLAVVLVDVTDEIETRDRLSEIATLRAKRAEELEVERARLNTIIQSIPIPLAVFDSDGRVATCNEAARVHAEQLGAGDWMQGLVTRGQAGFRLTDTSGKELRPSEGPLARSLNGEVCVGERMFLVARGRQPRAVLVNSSPLRDLHERITGAVVSIQDITDDENARRHERDIAEKLKQSILFEKLRPILPGFEVGDKQLFAEKKEFIGGDFYDIFRIDSDRVGVVIADVAGKGLKAAVYTPMTKYMLRAYALENHAPDQVVGRLNEALMECTPPEVFVTLIYGVMDSRTCVFRYANAGHEPPVLLTCQNGMACCQDVTGRALALVHGSRYECSDIEMSPGDLLVLYTDGVTDAGSGSNRYGIDRLLQLVGSKASLSAAELAETLMGEALTYSDGHMNDDAALVVIKAIDAEAVN
jgi:PAS domain-containing protein